MSKKAIIGIAIAVILVLVIVVVAISMANKPKNIEGTLEEIMTKLYEGVPEDQRPMALTNQELSTENIENFVGTKDVSFKEAMVSESLVGSIAHSVVLLRLNDAKDADATITTIKANANPRKWLCVEAENVIVKNKGDLVVLIMSNELAEKIESNFDGLE